MKVTHRSLLIVLPLILLVAAAPALAEDETGPDWGYTELDDVDLGTQLTGPPLSFYDLWGRVVVCFSWGITCPISTGAFPYVSQLNEAYKDRGVALIGFQVRRNPDVLENNVHWAIEHLKPNFPMSMLSNDWDWPARYLPWVIVFNHEGKRIYAGNIQPIKKVLDEALARAPDYLVGGPYEKLAALAQQISKDKEHVGNHLPSLREVAAKTDGDEAERTEAKSMIAHLTRHFEWQILKAAEDVDGVVETAAVYRKLKEMYRGDELGDQAGKLLAKLESAPGFKAEAAAEAALEQARITLRRLPPAGNYAYNMDYHESTDEMVLATRGRMIATFRVTLDRIMQEYPKTKATADAEYLKLEFQMPFLDAATAAKRVARADELLTGSRRAYELFEAYLLLQEVTEGYLEEDETSVTAKRMLAEVVKSQASRLSAAGKAHHALDEQEALLRAAIRRGGSALPKAEAERIIAGLRKAAAQAGQKSRLAKRTIPVIETLRASYEGQGSLGVAFNQKHQGDGVMISWVYAATAAEVAGLVPGDVILEFNGKPVESIRALSQAIKGTRPGQAVRVKVLRTSEERETTTIKVTLGRQTSRR